MSVSNEQFNKPGARTGELVPVLAAMAAAIVAYIPSLRSYFQWDDWTHLLHIANPRFNAWGFGNWFYRPMFLELFRAMYRAFGSNAVLWHAAELALYLACIALLYFFIRRIGLGRLAAFAGAAAFAVHPMHPEAVYWLSALSGVAAGFFGLAAAHVAITRRIPGFARGTLCVLLWMIAVLFKEEAASLIFVLPCLPFFVQGKKSRGETIGWGISCLFFIAGLVVFQLLESQCHVKTGNPTGHMSVDLLRRSAMFTLWLTDGAVPLLTTSSYLGGLILSIIPLLLWKRYPCLRLGLLWFFGTAMALGVTLAYLSPADRYAYIPSIGISLAVAALVDRVAKRGERIGCETWIPAALLLVCLVDIKWCPASQAAAVALIAFFLSDPIDELGSHDTYIAVGVLSIAYLAIQNVAGYLLIDILESAWSDLILPLIVAAGMLIARSIRKRPLGSWAELVVFCCLAFWLDTHDSVLVIASCALIYFIRSRQWIMPNLRNPLAGAGAWVRIPIGPTSSLDFSLSRGWRRHSSRMWSG